MSNAVRNAVRNGVTHGVRNGASHAVLNTVQTRPDQTRVLTTAVWGVSINACIHRQGSRGTTVAPMHGRYRAEIGGGF